MVAWVQRLNCDCAKQCQRRRVTTQHLLFEGQFHATNRHGHVGLVENISPRGAPFHLSGGLHCKRCANVLSASLLQRLLFTMAKHPFAMSIEIELKALDCTRLLSRNKSSGAAFIQRGRTRRGRKVSLNLNLGAQNSQHVWQINHPKQTQIV